MFFVCCTAFLVMVSVVLPALDGVVMFKRQSKESETGECSCGKIPDG